MSFSSPHGDGFDQAAVHPTRNGNAVMVRDRVASGARPSELLFQLDLDRITDKIVERALAAFACGKIFVIVNDRQVTGLGEEIPIEETFQRGVWEIGFEPDRATPR